MNRTWLAGVLVVLNLLLCPGAFAQFAHFARNTDTIEISGSIVLGSSATYEARVIPTTDVLGKIYNEWHSGQDDKQLRVSRQGISAYAFPVNAPVFFDIPASISDNAFHHVAYVYDGSEERIYLDGFLLAKRPAGGDIGDYWPMATGIGALFRDGYVHPAFVGYIDSIRISNNARYSGTSFVPPSGDLAPDANTLLLYNFSEAAGSATVADSSGNGHTGTLGIGFGGATSPELGVSMGLLSVQVSPGVITGGFGGTGTISMLAPVETDTVIDLSSSSAAAQVPTSVTLLAGQSTANFSITTLAVPSNVNVTISASKDDTTRSADLIVTPTSLVSLTLSTSTVVGGKSVTGTVKLSKLAPTGGWPISLASANPEANLPATVSVPAGYSSVKFSILTTAPVSATTGAISASFGGMTKVANLTVQPLTPVSIALTPSSLFGGGKVAVKVILTGLAPSSGSTVLLSCTNSAATCPLSMLIPAGKSNATIMITTVMPATTQTGTVTATIGGVSKSALLTVKYGIPTKLSLAFLPTAPSYTRGAVIALQATLKDGANNPISVKTVIFKEYNVTTGVRTELGSSTTDGTGKAFLAYTVPTDSSKTNIYVEVYFLGEGDYMPASKVSKKIYFSP